MVDRLIYFRVVKKTRERFEFYFGFSSLRRFTFRRYTFYVDCDTFYESFCIAAQLCHTRARSSFHLPKGKPDLRVGDYSCLRCHPRSAASPFMCPRIYTSAKSRKLRRPGRSRWFLQERAIPLVLVDLPMTRTAN